MKDLRFLQKLFFLLTMGFALYIMQACSDDEEDEPLNVGTLEEGYVPVTEYHEAVDLGLSVKWANCNVGASLPEEYGEYYAWGEIEKKDTYSSDNYKWYNGSSSTVTKYCTNSKYGTVDNITILAPEDDVAHVKWGGKWRIPTLKEFEELYNDCTWRWSSKNEIYGYTVTGPNGDSIFLPQAGYIHGNPKYLESGGEFGYQGDGGNYWTATLAEEFCQNANIFYFDRWGAKLFTSGGRSLGYTVRPVKD